MMAVIVRTVATGCAKHTKLAYIYHSTYISLFLLILINSQNIFKAKRPAVAERFQA